RHQPRICRFPGDSIDREWFGAGRADLAEGNQGRRTLSARRPGRGVSRQWASGWVARDVFPLKIVSFRGGRRTAHSETVKGAGFRSFHAALIPLSIALNFSKIAATSALVGTVDVAAQCGGLPCFFALWQRGNSGTHFAWFFPFAY